MNGCPACRTFDHTRPLGEQDVVVAAEVRAWLLPWSDEEIFVGRSPRGFEVVLLISEAFRPGIVCVQLEVKIAQANDVQAERAHRHEVLEWLIEIRQPLAAGEIKMEVIDECLVAGHRLEGVSVCKGHHLLASRISVLWAREEVDAHGLNGARRRVEQREVFEILRFLFTVGLADAECESVRRILPVIGVPEIRVFFSREEKRMRRCKRRERASLGAFRDEDAVLRSDADRIFVDHAAKLAMLRLSARAFPNSTSNSFAILAAERDADNIFIILALKCSLFAR